MGGAGERRESWREEERMAVSALQVTSEGAAAAAAGTGVGAFAASVGHRDRGYCVVAAVLRCLTPSVGLGTPAQEWQQLSSL